MAQGQRTGLAPDTPIRNSEDAATRLVDAATAHNGRLDIVISNAGIIRVGPVESTAPADYEAAVATMALAPVRLP